MSSTDFSTVNIRPDLLKNLASLGYSAMTPIQAQSLPPILEKSDLIAQAQTGSGKTAAFALGLLHHLREKRYRVQSLVLCPTRELADQVAKEIRRLARDIHNIKVLTLCGGMPFGPQIASLEHQAHIVVGTPGRIEEHLRKGSLNLSELQTLVLDEADRMLDMGFEESIDAILSSTPKQRQTLLFSATYPPEIQSVAQRVLQNPVTIKIETTVERNTIEQIFYSIKNNVSRMDALSLVLLKHRPGSAVVFCNTKKETAEIASALSDRGFSALALNGDLEQKMRDQVLVRFSNKSVSVLVATDVAARGLDIELLDLVVNYSIARELEVHVHRIGRTGRAGNQGLAITLLEEKENYKFERLQEFTQEAYSTQALPDLSLLKEPCYRAPMATLQIDGGKKQKVRAGDILGALTGENGISGKEVGKISIFDNCAYVAIQTHAAADALDKLEHGKLKGRSFRVRRIRG